MKAVEAAENEAAEKLAAARAEAEGIRKKSAAECLEMLSNVDVISKEKEEQSLKALDQEREAAVKKAEEEAAVKADELRGLAKDKEMQAIDAVLGKLSERR